MEIASRKKKEPELSWVLKPTSRSRHRQLVFQREAQAYLWRTGRSLLKIGKN